MICRPWKTALVTLFCLLGVSGCQLDLRAQVTSDVTVTERVVPSAMVAVVANPAAGSSLAGLVAATAQPGEDVSIIGAAASAVLAHGTAPAPARIPVQGRPDAPAGTATSFQQAKYRRSLALWQREVARAKQAVAARTRATVAAWVRQLAIVEKLARVSPPTGSGGFTTSAGSAGALAAECAVAASAFVGLDEQGGASFGNRRVALLYVTSLDGSLPPGELTGDDVIVVTSFLPSAAAIAQTQASLLAAAAAQATVVSPEATSAQIARLISAGLSQANAASDYLSREILFANNSAALTSASDQVLTPLIALLRQPGAFAWINGYASTPGSSETNYLLSYARAAGTASFFEAHGIPASSLAVVGHGASNLVAAGPSGQNRRVVVVIDVPRRP
jgi:outer membrane protein OmpA-like peptidoglycan-associated protein